MLNFLKLQARVRKKILKFQVLAIALIPLLSCINSASAQRQSANSNIKKPVCEPVARIISGDIRREAGSQVCQQDYLQPASTATVEVLCYNSATIVNLPAGVIGEQCSPLPQNQTRCSKGHGDDCLKTKGPREENRPTLITPYSILTLNPRPTLSWNVVPNAISYIVQIKGPEVDWSKEVNSNVLLYPEDEPAMGAGNVYAVNVLAQVEDQKYIPSSSILMVPFPDKAQQIKSVTERIQSLNLSPDEQAVDFDNVYKANELFTEAIEILKQRIKARTQNPTIYRRLGDRYLEVGLLEEASREYKLGIQYAKLRGDSNELVKAQKGLELSLQSQLPIRINPAQK